MLPSVKPNGVVLTTVDAQRTDVCILAPANGQRICKAPVHSIPFLKQECFFIRRAETSERVRDKAYREKTAITRHQHKETSRTMSADTVSQNAATETMTSPRVALLGPTRAAILDRLQQHGPLSVQALADMLGITVVAIRRHLELLCRDDLVATKRAPVDGRGRPATLYGLSEGAAALFPQRYDAFAGDVLNFLAERGGSDSVREFLSWRRERDIETLREAVTAETLHERLDQLAQALSDAGFSASVVPEDTGFALVQNHCAIADIAREHPEVCSYEASAFAEVLGDDVDLARRSTLAHGATHCVCSVTQRPAHPASLKHKTDAEEAES